MGDKKGKLEKIQGSNVLINGVWYDASTVAQYLPKEGTEIIYNANDNYELQFIKKSDEPKIQPKKQAFTPKNLQPQETKRNNERGREDSIIKQVIFKAAVEEYKIYPHKTLMEIYEELKSKFEDELK